MMVIADAGKVSVVAGIMAADAEVDDHNKDLVPESAFELHPAEYERRPANLVCTP